MILGSTGFGPPMFVPGDPFSPKRPSDAEFSQMQSIVQDWGCDPEWAEMSLSNWKHYVHLAKTEKHREEMARRRERRQTWRSAQVQSDWSRYPGAQLRFIRARKMNFRGEVQR